MNFIVINYDTLRYDHLGFKGLRAVHTPNWDRFARMAWDFTRCYTGSYPSLPQRCDCVTGRFVYPFYGWRDLPEDEVNLCRKLTDAGYRSRSMADGDMFALHGPGAGFLENDIIEPGVSVGESESAATALPCAPHKSRNSEKLRAMWALRNKLIENGEEEAWPQARVMRAAADWVATQARERNPFFLWIESWRIHETWIDPPAYVERYDPRYQGERVALPAYSPTTDYLTGPELNHINAMYAASVTFSDKWFGLLLDTLEREGLLDNTVVILTADHGYSLGDHGRTGKHAVAIPPQGPWPLYEECAHVPLLIHAPGQKKAGRCGELIQHVDLLPTLLDFAGIDAGPTAKGISLKPILEGKWLHTRDLAVTSAGMGRYPECGNTRITITSERHTLILPTDTQAAELYDLKRDPGQTRNLLPRHHDVAEELHSGFIELVRDLGIDEDKSRTWEDILRQPSKVYGMKVVAARG